MESRESRESQISPESHESQITDISNFGTTYTGALCTSRIHNDAGNITLVANSGKITVNGESGVELGTTNTKTTIKGDLVVEGSFNPCQNGRNGSENLEAETINIHGDSSFEGGVDVAGPMTVNGPLTLGGSFSPSGNVSIESNKNLTNAASTRYLVFGDQGQGSWRIGVSENNRLTFQRNDGNSWVTLGQLGTKN